MSLLTPSRFPGDPLGYAGNQAGHGLIGMVAAVGVMMAGLSPFWAAPVAAGLYLVLIEVLPGQVARDWRDSFDDMTHALAGAGMIPAAGISFPGGTWSGDWTSPVLLALWGAFMGWQMLRRWQPDD